MFKSLTRLKRWFNNLRVAQKLTLISIFFVMPDSVMLYLFITGINANIQFARLEQEGCSYQQPLEDLLQLIPEHRMLLDDGAEESVVKAKEAQVDAAFAALEDVNARLGADLQFTDEGLAKRHREHFRPALVRADWENLKAHLVELPPAARVEKHTELVAAIRTMITHAGDLSNLILDPDLDSYYLMDATLLALPETQDRLGEIISYGDALLREAQSSHEGRQQLAIYATLLKESDYDRVMASTRTALQEDPNFYGVSPTLQFWVPPALQEYSTANQRFIGLLDRMVKNEASGVTEQEFLEAGSAARQTSFTLWKIAEREVNTLLGLRIADYQFRRTKSLCVAALALCAAIGFVTFITRSISGPLQQQASELKEAIARLGAEIAERKRAEEELRLSEAQLSAAQKIADLGSWEWDLATGKMVWSEENYRIHGVSPEDFAPGYRAALEFVVFKDRRASHAIFEAAIRDGRPFSFEQQIVRRDGHERILHQRGEVVLGADGKAVKLVGTAQDVTERKRSEEELARVHRDLVEASRQAGMAEVATGVLHNVGNVLNTVNVSAMLISDRLGKSRITHLSNVAGMLRENAPNLGEFLSVHPKGKMLPAFIQNLAERLSAEQTELLQETGVLTKSIGHIKDIVSVQQNYARVSGILESLAPAALVNDALQMSATSLERHDVQVTREFSDVPPVQVDKHKVLQILTNIFRNAKAAMASLPAAERKITVRVEAHDHGHVRISVHDRGIGIAADDLSRIFAFGFTTKSEGHGFGLHSSALAAKEMGATLAAQSDGLGAGATFTLDLPMTAAAAERQDSVSLHQAA